jgi:hypothetical protein
VRVDQAVLGVERLLADDRAAIAEGRFEEFSIDKIGSWRDTGSPSEGVSEDS